MVNKELKRIWKKGVLVSFPGIFVQRPRKTTKSLSKDRKIGNRTFENVAELKYLETTITGLNCMQEEIKSRLNSGNACYHSVQSLLSSCLLSSNVKVKLYKTITLPVVLYGCEILSLTLREEYRLRVLESRIIRRIFGAKRDEVTGEWNKLYSE
jgi:hypothetical protein